MVLIIYLIINDHYWFAKLMLFPISMNYSIKSLVFILCLYIRRCPNTFFRTPK